MLLKHSTLPCSMLGFLGLFANILGVTCVVMLASVHAGGKSRGAYLVRQHPGRVAYK
jgi:hypothetical protein